VPTWLAVIAAVAAVIRPLLIVFVTVFAVLSHDERRAKRAERIVCALGRWWRR